MLNKFIRLLLVSIVAVQAFVIYDLGKQQESTSTHSQVRQAQVDVIATMQEEMDAIEAVLQIKEKLVTELEFKLDHKIAQNKELRDSLASAYDEINAYSNQMLVSYGTVAETAKLLADIAGNVSEVGVSSNDLSALYAIMQEVEFLYESPDDFAVFHASFMEHLMGLTRRKTSQLYQKLLQYSEQALQSGLVANERPSELADAIAWDVKRSLLNDRATLAIMEILADEELIAFEQFYQNGILNPPDFGIKSIGSPIVLSKEEIINSGGQIYMVDENKMPIQLEQ